MSQSSHFRVVSRHDKQTLFLLIAARKKNLSGKKGEDIYTGNWNMWHCPNSPSSSTHTHAQTPSRWWWFMQSQISCTRETQHQTQLWVSVIQLCVSRIVYIRTLKLEQYFIGGLPSPPSLSSADNIDAPSTNTLNYSIHLPNPLVLSRTVAKWRWRKRPLIFFLLTLRSNGEEEEQD